jgi:salicylate 5-hydroxylase large subunit
MSALPTSKSATEHTVHWHASTSSRVPYATYTDEARYKRELEVFFYGAHWSYVGLECEIEQPGDFKRTAIGERSVIVVRQADGSVAVIENRCAHRGVAFCVKTHGNAKDFTCPYHQWNYDLAGNLQGLPFKRGVRVAGEDGKPQINGGMPADFDPKAHSLTKLQVHVEGGVIFASFSADVPPFAEYLGRLLPWFRRCFDGRKLTLLGYSRQRIGGNWKLMQENIKDPYHPGLLHTWFNTFGLWRADQKSMMKMDERHRHAAMISQKNDGGKGAVTQGVSSFKEHMQLGDTRVLDVVPEAWWAGNSACMLTIFPSLICQHNVNSISTRQIIPAGVGAFDFVWTHFGFAEDDEAMTRRRLRQANLFGPAGYVSADDGEVIELSQRGFEHRDDAATLCELDGREVGDTPHMVTETLIRGMYSYYRQCMGEAA